MIRNAEEKDLPALLDLAFEFHKAARSRRFATFEVSKTGWENWLKTCIASPDHLCLIAEKDNKPQGFLTAIIVSAYWNQAVRAACQATLWVRKESRKNGVGGALINEFMSWGCASGVDMITSGSSVHAEPKVMGALLCRHGFSLEERTYVKRVK